MTFEVLHCPDSFAFLRGMVSDAVDVIVTDPPYPEHVQSNMCSGSLVGTKSVPKYELGFEALADKQREHLAECVRIAKRWSLIFCSVEDFGLYRALVGPAYVRGGIWYKSNAMGQLTGDRPAAAYEGVACLHRAGAAKYWNGRGSYGIWRCNGTRGKKDRHPNEKPLNLCLKLVALFTERGETVFDPFCGSGAIGEACLRLGRNYVGLDSDISWVGKSMARLLDVEAEVAVAGGITDEDALTLCNMPKVSEKAADDPSFEESFTALGYQYGEEALQNVRLGWELRSALCGS